MFREQLLILESQHPYDFADALDRKGIADYALINDEVAFFGDPAEVWRYTVKGKPYFCLNKRTAPYRMYFYEGQQGLITSGTDVRNWAEYDEKQKKHKKQAPA